MNIVPAVLAVVGALALSAVVGGQAPGPLTTVAAVDLGRYEGQWFEVARFLWILSRTPTLDAATYDRAVAIARARDFDVRRLVKTGL